MIVESHKNKFNANYLQNFLYGSIQLVHMHITFPIWFRNLNCTTIYFTKSKKIQF